MKMSSKAFHRGKYYVAFKRGFEDCKKDITVIIDRMFESDILRISLSDDDDPTFLCTLNVTRFDYEELKKQQGLLIDFDNFPSQLVRLLQQCASNNMFLIMQQTNPLQYYFEIIEHNEFKKLVHLSLKTAPATDADIKQHMTDTINNLKKALASLKAVSSSSEAIWNDKCVNMERKINDLSHALTKMEEDKLRRETEYQDAIKLERERLAQERLQWQKNAEVSAKSQLASHQESLVRKEKQNEELNSICKQLRDNIGQLEKQISEKSQRLSVLEAEVQKSHIEVATLNAKNISLDREIVEKDKQYHQLCLKCTHLEKTIKDNSDTIKNLTNSLNMAKQEKKNLEERITLCESLAMKNNETTRATSEQLLKANQIISKQNIDLNEMKEKLLCRTAIALEQEKVIERNTKEMEDLRTEVTDTKSILDKIKCELESFKEKYENSEKALKDRNETIKNNNMVIQWLHKKLEMNTESNDTLSHGFGKSAATSSTPYFLSRNNHTNSSDESINFYATSKTSQVGDSSQVVTEERTSKIGLDPKYLKPAVSDNKSITKENPKTKLVDPLVQKGKENKNIDLPKVDYRDKKSSRGTIYRATPVSAYFP